MDFTIKKSQRRGDKINISRIYSGFVFRWMGTDVGLDSMYSCMYIYAVI